MIKQAETFLPESALKIADEAIKNAINAHDLDAAFNGMQYTEINGRPCLIVSIAISEKNSNLINKK